MINSFNDLWIFHIAYSHRYGDSLVYGLFGLIAEMLNTKEHVKPLISVGFHTAIVYTILVYVIGILATIDVMYAAFLLCAFMLYFIYTMFLAISTIYEFSLSQTLIVLFVPFLLLALALMIVLIFYPDALRVILGVLLA